MRYRLFSAKRARFGLMWGVAPKSEEGEKMEGQDIIRIPDSEQVVIVQSVDHAGLRCDYCCSQINIQVPCRADIWINAATSFMKIHSICKKPNEA